MRRHHTLAVAAAAVACWLSPAPARADANEPMGTGGFRLVSPGWVAERLDDADLRIIDARIPSGDYLNGHLPGAVHLAEAALRAPRNGLPVQFLPPADLAGLLAKAGVTNDHSVLVYSDAKNVLGATLTAYALMRLGHDSVMVMDGGYDAYAGAGHPVTKRYPEYRAGSLSPGDNNGLYVTIDQVRTQMRAPDALFIDARPAAQYRGEVDIWMRNGHIPGAINIDWTTLMRPDNGHAYKARAEIEAIFAASNVTKDKDIVVYCGTGREATLMFLYLKEILGYPRVRLFEGSWTEYSSHADLPVATGPGPGGR